LIRHGFPFDSAETGYLQLPFVPVDRSSIL
jgi:hypothetical protein